MPSTTRLQVLILLERARAIFPEAGGREGWRAPRLLDELAPASADDGLALFQAICILNAYLRDRAVATFATLMIWTGGISGCGYCLLEGKGVWRVVPGIGMVLLVFDLLYQLGLERRVFRRTRKLMEDMRLAGKGIAHVRGA